jgi:hypothetical protein
MASVSTGEMFTNEEVEAMTPQRRQELDLVRVTPSEQAHLETLKSAERREWLKKNKTLLKITRKRERQNRKAGRRG